MLAGSWSSLEVAKLFVAVLTPLAIFFLGVWGARQARRWEHRQWVRRTLFERRLHFWDQMSPALNDVLCFFTLVGHFQQITPPRAVKLKREVDKMFFANEHLFPQAVRDAYAEFIKACYKTYTGRAEDAKLRSSAAVQRSERKSWDAAWDPLFVTSAADVTPLDDITAKYRALVRLFTTDESSSRTAGESV